MVEVLTGKALKAAREARGMSQEQLANASGITVGTISRLERGDTAEPELATARKLFEALGPSPRAHGAPAAAAVHDDTQQPSDAIKARALDVLGKVLDAAGTVSSDEFSKLREAAPGCVAYSPSEEAAVERLTVYLRGLRGPPTQDRTAVRRK
jgi:transcriptional regulator with XRE-family HTH domain